MRNARIAIIVIAFILLAGIAINYSLASSRHQRNLGNIRNSSTGGFAFTAQNKEDRYWNEQDGFSDLTINSLIATGLIIIGASGSVIILKELEKKETRGDA